MSNNTPGIRGYDYVEFYVGSAKSLAYWHVQTMGFKLAGYMGPETGIRDRVSWYLVQNNIKIVITSALQPDTFEVSGFVKQHGLGVKRWAVEVDNVEDAFHYSVKKGAIPVSSPCRFEDDHGYIEEAAFKIYDDTELVIVNSDHYQGIFRPGFEEPTQAWSGLKAPVGLLHVDHIVGNVRGNEMNLWADYFNRSFDFEEFMYFGPGDISTKYSALLSKVVCSKDRRIKNPINEPHYGLKKSQIEEYLDEYYGSGVQHIALTTDNIVTTIRAMRASGIEFLRAPDSYYDSLREKVEGSVEFEITESLDDLQECGILCDLEGKGYLLQLFTKPIGDRPTFFYEVIQRRKGAEGFGQGNFQALFEAIEQEQERRGNLERE